MAKRVDRRVLRTQNLLRAALLSLVRERGFEELSVQDIIDRANVGRATFYAHFDNKEDLLVSGFEELRRGLMMRQREAATRARGGEERWLVFSCELLSHANDHRDVYQAMLGKQSGAIVQRIFQKLLVDLVRQDIRLCGGSAAQTEPLVHFLAGSFYGLLTWWLEGKMRLPVREANELFRRMAIPALRAGIRPD